MDKVLQFLSQINDLNNTQAPIVGPIRKFNYETFGKPAYLNPQLSPEEQQKAFMLALVLAGGGKGDAAKKFGLALRNAGPRLKVDPSNVNKLIDQRPSIHPPDFRSFDLLPTLANARKLLRKDIK